jgi:tetratricopeptide (TPR) repeat protein
MDDGFHVKSIPFELKSNTKNGIDSYDDGKYDEALQYLEQVNSKNSDEIAIKNYYLGVSFLAKNNANSAINALLKAKTCTLKIIRDNSDWYLALAYLKKNDKGNMKIAFEAIASNPNHPYNSKAKSLLKLLF